MIFVNVAALTLLAAAVSLMTRERIEKTLPFAMFATILCLYVPALAGMMGAALVWAWRAASAAAFALAALYCAKRRGEAPASWKALLFTPGLLAFAVLAVFLWGFSRACEPVAYDEFSHWALTVKDMFYRNRLSTDALAATDHKTYPPAMALWQYLFAKSLPDFSPGTLYYAYNLFLVLTLMPLFSRVRWRRAAVLPALAAAVFLIPYAFYSQEEGLAWGCLYIDRALALCFAYALMSYFLEDEKTPFVCLRTGLALAVLSQLKSTGNFTAALAAVMIAVDGAARSDADRRKKAARCALLLVPWAVALVAWNAHLRIMRTPKRWDLSVITPQAVLTLLTGEDQMWKYRFTKGFAWRLVSRSSVAGALWVGYLAQPLVWLALMLAARPAQEKGKRRALTLWGVLLAGYLIQIGGLYASYMFLFTLDDAAYFVSFDRYLAAYWMGAYAFSLSLLLDRALRADGPRRADAARLLGALALVCLCAPLGQAASDLRLGDGRNEALYAALHERTDGLRQAHEFMGDGGRTFVLFNSDNSRIYQYARYEFLPGGACGVNDWNFAGSLEEWTGTLTDGAYDHVWVERADEDFIARCGASFEGGVTEKTLYEVRREDGGAVRLIPVLRANP